MNNERSLLLDMAYVGDAQAYLNGLGMPLTFEGGFVCPSASDIENLNVEADQTLWAHTTPSVSSPFLSPHHSVAPTAHSISPRPLSWSPASSMSSYSSPSCSALSSTLVPAFLPTFPRASPLLSSASSLSSLSSSPVPFAGPSRSASSSPSPLPATPLDLSASSRSKADGRKKANGCKRKGKASGKGKGKRQCKRPQLTRARNVQCHVPDELIKKAIEDRSFICPAHRCGYVQRNKIESDFLRHVQSHDPIKWICIGVSEADAEMFGVRRGSAVYSIKGRSMTGGCLKHFSRYDALTRHVTNSDECCGLLQSLDWKELSRETLADDR